MPQAVLAPPEQQRTTYKKPLHCTTHRQKVRFHVLYADFEDICAGDVRLAHALRICETLTDQRIAHLRASHDIPESHVPHEDDLWFPLPYRLVETLSLHALSKSTCQRVFGESQDGDMPSLIDLGYVRRRYVARPGYEGAPRPGHATVYRDEQGDFIVVDADGNYTGGNGTMCNAFDDDYTRIERQYLYCFDAVNAAIAESDGLEAPEELPRWEVIIAKWEPGGERRKRQKKSVDHYLAQETTKSPTNDSHDAKDENTAARKGTNHNDSGSSFRKQNNTLSTPMSISSYGSTISDEVLRSAPWCVETLLGLSSRFLVIPPTPDESDEEAMDAWQRDYAEPARRLMEATRELSPQLAWERIDLTMRYMATPGSPSWWQRLPGDASGQWRRVKAQITLKNVADRFVEEYEEFKVHQWYPSETTRYDGPALEYVAGYGGVEVVATVEEPVIVVESDAVVVPIEEIEEELPPEEDADELPRQAVSMPLKRADELAREIYEQCPELLCATAPDEAEPDMVLLGIQCDVDEWFDVDRLLWRSPNAAEQTLIRRARAYGASVIYKVIEGENHG